MVWPTVIAVPGYFAGLSKPAVVVVFVEPVGPMACDSITATTCITTAIGCSSSYIIVIVIAMATSIIASVATAAGAISISAT